MKKERKKERKKEDEDEKQELEFAEGFQRINKAVYEMKKEKKLCRFSYVKSLANCDFSIST